MVKSLIWDEEEDYRQEEISKWFEEATGLKRSDNLKDYTSKIKKLMEKRSRGEKLTDKERDLTNYVKGEINIESLIKESFEKIKGLQKEKLSEFIAEVIEKRKFVAVKERTYKVSQTKTIGFVKGVEQKVRIEEYISKGEKRYRLRNSKGQLAGFIKPAEEQI